MRPRLVDEILATVARGRNLASALTARNDMMAPRGDFPQTKDTGVIHRTDFDLSESVE
jgi:hypothetical protein